MTAEIIHTSMWRRSSSSKAVPSGTVSRTSICSRQHQFTLFNLLTIYRDCAHTSMRRQTLSPRTVPYTVPRESSAKINVASFKSPRSQSPRDFWEIMPNTRISSMGSAHTVIGQCLWALYLAQLSIQINALLRLQSTTRQRLPRTSILSKALSSSGFSPLTLRDCSKRPYSETQPLCDSGPLYSRAVPSGNPYCFSTAVRQDQCRFFKLSPRSLRHRDLQKSMSIFSSHGKRTYCFVGQCLWIKSIESKSILREKSVLREKSILREKSVLREMSVLRVLREKSILILRDPSKSIQIIVASSNLFPRSR